MRRVVLLCAVVACTLSGPAAGQATPRSQHGSVSQRVGLTDIAIAYNRPVARGRALFGSLVPWGRVWHPGADSATTISVSRDVQIEGHDLPAGRYTLWTIPTPDRWTVIFSHAVDVFHIPYPGEAQDALRVTVAPEQGGPMEVLAFYFPVVGPDSAVLRLHWGTTIVPIRIHTQ
ncbi:MAG: hypothetical protein DMD37_07235 [Gemmatimonadetes bacterium]|nr:MAG: hypothetical protein DMD74_02115 [Gemmatimonadota bacterium]PYO86447.1 MAG: hypothetical protein DMD68_00075 [Gemmatimonadota bacterium]PYP63141.1 MAG: hypothetical protein DMD37_07235 [Gemmatimonadota bacterium]